MERKILTWLPQTNDGAFQKTTENYGIFGDAIKVKPELGFNYSKIEYIEEIGKYLVDSLPMTEEQKLAVENFIVNYELPLEFKKYALTQPHYSYLGSTDFYFTIDKYATLTEEVKAELTAKRQFARDEINRIEALTEIN